MSDSAKSNLTKEKILSLLAAVGKGASADEQQVQADDYDWHQPHCFNREQLEKLNALTETLASALADKSRSFFQQSFTATVASTSQHYAGKLINQLTESSEKDYYLTLKDEKDIACGLVIAPAPTCTAWLRLLLGESESKEESEEQLSQLESSLLSDITTSLTEAICRANDKLNLQPETNTVSRHFSLQIRQSKELCRITFNIRKDDEEQDLQLQLIVPCTALTNIVGQAQSDRQSDPKKTQDAILEYVKEIPVAVTAELATTELTFEQVLTLQSGDILILDKKIGEPVQLIIEGQPRFMAQPAKSEGSLAVVITAADFDPNSKKT